VSSDESDAIVPSRKPFLTLDTREGLRIKCPNCSAQYVYKDHHRMKDGRVHCQNCGALIDAVGEDVLVYEAPAESTGQENAVLLLIVALIILFVPLIFAVPALICIAAFKFCGPLRSEQDETKIYRRDTEGPDLR
jgi:predicted Zn finger-like uncharacterized protein